MGPDVLRYDASVGGSGRTSMTSVPPGFGPPCASTVSGSRTAPDDAARACRKSRRVTLDIALLLSCCMGLVLVVGPAKMLRGLGGAVFQEFLGRPREQEALLAEFAVEGER